MWTKPPVSGVKRWGAAWTTGTRAVAATFEGPLAQPDWPNVGGIAPFAERSSPLAGRRRVTRRCKAS
jgi:hypothetical protein